MHTHRRTAIIVGALYIIGTVAGILSVAFTGPILDEPETITEVFAEVSANEDHVIVGGLFVLLMGLSLAMVPVMMFPVLKQYNEALALGYVVFRGALEAITYIVTVISWLLLITFSQEYATARNPDDPAFHALGTLLLQADDWIGHILTIVFIVGALIFYYVLYRTRLIPRWLSSWGLIAAIPYFASALLGMFGLITPFSTSQIVLVVPLAIQEMVLAVWLIVKGFNASAILSESAKPQ